MKWIYNNFFLAIDVQSILNLELEPKVKPAQSSTFSIPGSTETTAPKSPLSPECPASPPPQTSISPTLIPEESTENTESVDLPVTEEGEQITANVDDNCSNQENISKKDDKKDEDSSATNIYYTPDEEEHVERVTRREPVFEEPESVSYVPPFNNPIYPNDSFTSYTSTIGKKILTQQIDQMDNFY